MLKYRLILSCLLLLIVLVVIVFTQLPQLFAPSLYYSSGPPASEDSALIIYYCSDNSDTSFCLTTADGSQKWRLMIEDDSNSQLRMSSPFMNSKGQIAYTCEDAAHMNVCRINFDGTGFKQLTYGVLPTTVNRVYSFNDSGDIAFACEVKTEHAISNICTIDYEGDNRRIVTWDTPNSSNRLPRMDNSGQIVYRCHRGTSVNICVINRDGTGYMQIASEALLNSFSQMDLNDQGQIVFSCLNVEGFSNICAVNSDGSELRMVTEDLPLEDYERASFYDPVINNSSQIAFTCSFERLVTEICSIDYDGTDFKNLTRSIGNGHDSSPQISHSGLIAYSCGITDQRGNVCVINGDGTGHRTITNLSTLGAHLKITNYGGPQFAE